MRTLAHIIAACSVLPDGFTLVGYIDKHPSDGQPWFAVVRSRLGLLMAWDGVSLRPLPIDFKKLCKFEPA